MQAIIGQPGKRHLNGVTLAGRWWPNVECWPGSFVIFQGIRTSIANKSYIFVIFQAGSRTLPPSGSVHYSIGPGLHYIQNISEFCMEMVLVKLNSIIGCFFTGFPKARLQRDDYTSCHDLESSGRCFTLHSICEIVLKV